MNEASYGMAPPNNMWWNDPIKINQDDDHVILQFKTQFGPCFNHLQLQILKAVIERSKPHFSHLIYAYNIKAEIFAKALNLFDRLCATWVN